MLLVNTHGLFLWKIKKGITITNAFQKNLHTSRRKQNKTWLDKGSEFYNRSMKSWLQHNRTEVYSTRWEGKPAVVERFIRNCNNKIYKYVISILKKCVDW